MLDFQHLKWASVQKQFPNDNLVRRLIISSGSCIFFKSVYNAKMKAFTILEIYIKGSLVCMHWYRLVILSCAIWYTDTGIEVRGYKGPCETNSTRPLTSVCRADTHKHVTRRQKVSYLRMKCYATLKRTITYKKFKRCTGQKGLVVKLNWMIS